MPTSSRRQAQRKQRQEKSWKTASANTTISPLSNNLATSPHPYHASPTPPYSQIDQRITSSNSQPSDLSVDEHSGTQAESLLEYSDTSGEEREDAYFLADPSSRGGASRLLGDDPVETGESSFREMRAGGSKSSRVVQFSSNGSSTSSMSFMGTSTSTLDTSPQPSMTVPHPAPHPGFNSPALRKWVKNFAYSFRSPEVATHKTSNPHEPRHRSQLSSGIMEYPYSSSIAWRPDHGHFYSSNSSLYMNSTGSGGPWEETPLVSKGLNGPAVYGLYPNGYTLAGHPLKASNGDGGDRGRVDSRSKHGALRSKSTAATVAAFFLLDYEAGRPPTLSPNFEMITPLQLRIYRVHFSWMWRYFGVNLAVLVLFLAHSRNRLTTAVMHTFSIIFLFIEVWMREQLYGQEADDDRFHTERRLNRPLILFLLILGLESWVWYIFPPDPLAEVPALVSSVFKPVVFFYVSQKARHALEGLSRITTIVVRVVMIELFLILGFAAVACQLYGDYGSFKNLSSSWLSLFELSTTVVNPSLWMPMYEVSPSNSVFFIFFIIVSVFYLHSLVLSVVFQTYIHAATEIHDRSVADREEAIRQAFVALMRDEKSDFVSTSSVRKALQIVRPHYSSLKIKALMEIVDPADQRMIDYPSFRTRIRQALNASIRTTRSDSSFAMGIELIAALVAAFNFFYVILLTSEFSAEWFDAITVSAGSTITLLGLFELVVRFNPLRIRNFTPITRLNATFDGLALVGALVSCVGIFQYLTNSEGSVDFILTGRAIDMIRIMRFFPLFRDVVRRSADVFPAMTGPILLVLTTMHGFVSLGIALWGDAIDPVQLSTNQNLTPLYYLNNFNSYMKGLVTIFNVLVVNDWHAIAEVFLYADRCSSPFIVYPFFVATILSAVFIMLNVITAFFVESFVTKIEEIHLDNRNNDHILPGRTNDFMIQTKENTNVRHISSGRNLRELSEPTEQDPILTADDPSIHSTNSGEIFNFDVYEREGFDQIMRTVAGGSSVQEQEAFARSVCDYLEMFENLSSGREKVGYMVCCQQSMNRFGNRRFQNSARDFANENVLHKVVSDMHSELLVLSTRKKFEDRCLVRTFPHKSDPSLKLEISASLLRSQPAVSLLVSRIRPESSSDP